MKIEEAGNSRWVTTENIANSGSASGANPGSVSVLSSAASKVTKATAAIWDTISSCLKQPAETATSLLGSKHFWTIGVVTLYLALKIISKLNQ